MFTPANARFAFDGKYVLLLTDKKATRITTFLSHKSGATEHRLLTDKKATRITTGSAYAEVVRGLLEL
jgi:hypothetical protein